MRSPSTLRQLTCALALGAANGPLSACAASPPPPAASLDEAFAAIQVHEARIEHARATTQTPTTECAAVCVAEQDAAGSATELCAIARQSGDPDALTRCEAGSRSAATIQQQSVQRCGCGERVP